MIGTIIIATLGYGISAISFVVMLALTYRYIKAPANSSTENRYGKGIGQSFWMALAFAILTRWLTGV